MLLPALGKARALAKKNQCINNLKQIGQGYMMYESDNDGYLPPYFVTGHNLEHFQHLIAQYLEITESLYDETNFHQLRRMTVHGRFPVFECPAGINAMTSDGVVDHYYEQNRYLAQVAMSVATWVITYPNVKKWKCDGSQVILTYDKWCNNVCQKSPTPNTHSDPTGRNILFADGHVIFGKSSEFDNAGGTDIDTSYKSTHW
jgi:prepilin-type processing-associated H-X9-DG protein